MIYYCDMGPDGAEIRSARFKPRTVGRYLIYQSGHPPIRLLYQAHTIVILNDNGDLVWYKHRQRDESTLLTKEEQQELTLQILKSETW